MMATVTLTGDHLEPADLRAVARDGTAVLIADLARARIRVAAALVGEAAAAGTPIYGVTTGLGARVVQRVDEAELSEFSMRTLRGRAMAVGEPLPTELVRAAMAVRLNGLCAGGAGAGEAVADGLAALLNAGVHPIVPADGSVGASDLCLMAHIGLVLVGEGDAELAGEIIPGGDAIARVGLAPVALAPKDGLAICSSSGVSVGAAALVLLDAERALVCAQAAAALSMEGFRANLSPLDLRVVAARPAPGQGWSSAGLRALLAGGSLAAPGAARRLQDPLSFRCVASIHGSLRTALDLLAAALEPELAGAADNPLVLPADGEILSTGNFHCPALAMALDMVAVALAQVAAPSAQRQARIRTGRLSGLPHNLVTESATRSGYGPIGKTADALVVEIRQRTAPFSVHPTISADAVEDDSTSALQAALRTREQIERVWRLLAIELAVAAQAVDLAAPAALGVGTAITHAAVRDYVDPMDEDRALGPEVERLAVTLLRSGELGRRLAMA
jgi:histidine ammonia-lyase